MYKIKIDTTDRIIKSVKLVSVEEGIERVVDEKSGNIDITSSIRDLLQEHHIDKALISDFEANPGPGSFTGLKIGMTIANVFNWALGKKKVNELTFPQYGREPNITIKKDI